MYTLQLFINTILTKKKTNLLIKLIKCMKNLSMDFRKCFIFSVIGGEGEFGFGYYSQK